MRKRFKKIRVLPTVSLRRKLVSSGIGVKIGFDDSSVPKRKNEKSDLMKTGENRRSKLKMVVNTQVVRLVEHTRGNVD